MRQVYKSLRTNQLQGLIFLASLGSSMKGLLKHGNGHPKAPKQVGVETVVEQTNNQDNLETVRGPFCKRLQGLCRDPCLSHMSIVKHLVVCVFFLRGTFKNEGTQPHTCKTHVCVNINI